MKASEIMTREVVAVPPEMPARDIAKLLVGKRISAVPVVDADGAPIGVVSEGDLIGRAEADRSARRDWWLALAAGGTAEDRKMLPGLHDGAHLARDIMTSPVVTVGEDTDSGEIARLLTSHHIKRVPVVKAGKVVGIVSRGDLMRVLAAALPPEQAMPRPGLLTRAIADLDGFFASNRDGAAKPKTAPAGSRAAEPEATEFARLNGEFAQNERDQRKKEKLAAEEARRNRVTQMIESHISDEKWRLLVQDARLAARAGQNEYMLLRFPSQLCSDGGRAINVTESDWPATLRGEAAELYLRWEQDLKPHGFHLAAQILDFPGGFPGDVGMYLIWGQQ
jgi:CBS domain-containing protein